MKRPNLIYLHSHDTGRFTQPYGHAVPTPNLLRLAKDSIVFRQAYCAAPTCSPSRAAMLTGQSAHASGMLGLAHRGFGLHHPERHLVHTLRRAGYRTVLAGEQHVARNSTDIGYDELPRSSNHSAAVVAPAAAEWLRTRPGEPFFLDVGFTETHRPFPAADPRDDPRCLTVPPGLPDTPEIRADVAAFHTSARIMDEGVGIVLRALEESGLMDNAIILSTTDHGLAFPSMKCTLSDRGIGVSLILRPPGGVAGGMASDALVSHVDVFPTLCALMGIDPPDWLRGRSLLPILQGEADEVNDAVFAEVTFHAAYEPMRAVRTKRWKYIRRFDNRGRVVLPNCGDSPLKTLWMENGWRDRTVPEEELYDLLFDPIEARNLAGSGPVRTIHEEMRDRLDYWMRETDDPLHHGSLDLPEGVVVNDPDGVSPQEPTQSL